MRKLRKTVAMLLACSSLVGALAGLTACGGKGGLTKEEEEFVSGGGTIVRYYSFNSAAINKELEDALKNDFYVKNPNIRVKLTSSVGASGNFYTNVLNDYVGGVEADVYNMEPGEIYPFLQAGYLEPLDSYFANSTQVSLDDIWEANKKAYMYNADTDTFGTGKTYAVMKDWTTDSMILYNRDLFTADQLKIIEKDEDKDGIFDPMTFDEFKTLATGLVKADSSKNILQYGFLPGLAEAKVLVQMLMNAGLSWFDSSDYTAAFEDAEVKKVLEWYYGILAKNKVKDAAGEHYPIFAQGKVAMIMGGLYTVNAHELDKMNIGVAYPPVKDKNTECKPVTTGCVGFAMNKRSKVKDAAFKFIEWYLQYYAKVDGTRCSNFPALKKAATDYTLNPEINTNAVRLTIAQKFYDSLDKAVVLDRNKYCSQASFETIELTYAGEYMSGTSDVIRDINDFCEILADEVDKIVAQSKIR